MRFGTAYHRVKWHIDPYKYYLALFQYHILMANRAFILVALCFNLAPIVSVAQTIAPQKIDCTQFTNLYRLNDSIYRSEQPSSAGMIFLDSIGIRSLLSIRSKSDSSLAAGKDFAIYHIPMEPTKFFHEDVVAALTVLNHSPKPLLVHCSRGADRTGLIIAAYRIVYGGWSNEQAIEEMRNGGYHFDQSLENMIRYLNAIDAVQIRKQLSDTSRKP